MKNVLIVDDERFFLMSLVEGLGTYAADFNTLTAENGKKALAVLRSTLVDLVITDLKMPEMDGFELLTHMSKEFSDIPVVVMTAYATPEIKNRLEGLGTFQLMEKPIDFRELVDTIFTQLSSISKGYIRGITLPAFLQLVEMEKKTCTLKVMSKGRIGYLYFFEGTLVEANNGIETAEDAAYDIVCWDEAEIEISNTCRDKTRRIASTLGHVLMDGFRIKDERLHKQELRQGAEHIALGDDFASILKSIEGTGEGGEDYKSDSGTKEEKMASLREILKEFTKLQGVSAVCLVGRDGFLLDSIAHTGIDTEMIGAIASSGFGASESMGRQLGKGVMAMSMIEFENGPVMFSPVGDDAFIVVIADKESNLGMVRLKLKKHSHELATVAAI
jgi:predicted regulator of Ras-like GTPase activity (Roadblock/LC7/MglB family)/ActR/RegA family two-component response regulator